LINSTPQTLLELNQIHRELDCLFFIHQVAVLKCDCVKARNSLNAYEEALLHHMKEEDEILLPLYQQRAVSIRGGDSEIFSLEHKKISEWLGRLKMRLSRLVPPEPDYREVIALLDDEAQYKKYMEHHSLREDRIFYPEVERVVDAKEKKQLLRLLTFTFAENGHTS
jgi:iron-sulfur cluster repair protein YtfE (RIC family)